MRAVCIQAIDNYSAKEKDGNIGPVIYETGALSKTTPVDLGGRKFVAPAAAAQKNVKVRLLYPHLAID